jgi:hypothetical protein
MLKPLSLITALSVATIPLLPQVAHSQTATITFPQVIQTQPSVVYPSANTRTVIVNPYGNTRTVIIQRNNGFGTNGFGTFGTYGYPQTVIVAPIIQPPTVIIKPGYSRRTCSTAILGSPIPSPIPLNQATGLPCW